MKFYNNNTTNNNIIIILIIFDDFNLNLNYKNNGVVIVIAADMSFILGFCYSQSSRIKSCLHHPRRNHFFSCLRMNTLEQASLHP